MGPFRNYTFKVNNNQITSAPDAISPAGVGQVNTRLRFFLDSLDQLHDVIPFTPLWTDQLPQERNRS
jgi:hypothetical protein